jgi:Cof subfamily protein (haloacid dehalogenase superfamily)
MRIKAVVSDVDGTLMTSGKTMTPGTQDAVRKLHEAGILFAVTSGRAPHGLNMLVNPLAITTPMAAFNGGLFIAPDKTVIEEHALAANTARQAIELIQKHGMETWVYSPDAWFVCEKDNAHIQREIETIDLPPTIITDFDAVLGNALKIVGVSDDLDLVARCEKDAQTALGAGASAMRSQPYYLDITHPAANKGAVIATFSRLLSVHPDEIATIGDGRNDVLMFRVSGLSIAMGNADAYVKNAARCVTDTNNDDGFAKAVDRYILGAGEAP